MPRITRAMAAQAADEVVMHIDNDEKDEEQLLGLQTENGGVSIIGKDSEYAEEKEVVSIVTPDAKTERKPLGEIAPNSAEGKKMGSAGGVEVKKTRGQRGGKKSGKACSQREEDDNNHDISDGEGEDELALSEDMEVRSSKEDDKEASANHKALSESVIENMSPIAQDVTTDPLASQAEELSKSQLSSPIAEAKTSCQLDVADCKAEQALPKTLEPEVELTALDAPASPLPSAMPKVVESLRKASPAKRSTSNKENVQPIESPASEVLDDGTVNSGTMPLETATPLPLSLEQSALAITASPLTRKGSRTEDNIEALDNLNEAVERINDELPQVIDSPMKKSVTVKEGTTASKRNSMLNASPVKARSTSMSSSKTPKASTEKPAMRARPSSIRQSTTLSRTNSLKKVPEANSLSNKRPSPASRKLASDKSEPAEKRETIIPHSKPRPVSISFPTPPPPPKSTKAPTRSTFTLPGEAIAAKLKAAKEERMKKEAEEKERKPAFKARPAPTSTLKRAPSVRQTASSAARLSLAGGKPIGTSSRDSIGSHRRTQSAAVTSSTASKRSSTIQTAKPMEKPSTADGPVNVAKRQSTIVSNASIDRLSKPRISSLEPPKTTAPKPKPATVPRGPTLGHQRAASAGVISKNTGTIKGKEVFKRAANAKAAAEKEKKEKEDAAKKARAAAAERGRQASRDWAEKQKLKKLGLKPVTDTDKTIVDLPTGEGHDSTVSAQVVKLDGGDDAAQAAAI